MPKKTKKEKIIAELRRKLETREPQNEKDDEVIIKQKDSYREQTPIPNYQLPTVRQSRISQPALINLPVNFILRDLKKTFILAGLAISFEFIIYWLTELGGSKFFHFLPIFK